MFDIDILAAIKAGMKGELDSVTVYEDAAKAATGKVKEFFTERAEAEKRHFNYLLGYYRDKVVHLTPERNIEAELGGGWRSAIIGKDFLGQVAASRHLTAAIAAALHLEADAVALYSDWATRTTTPELKSLLEMMATWEKQHYDDLLVIQEELEQHYFDINNFQPF
ncbi:MAG: ferritin family protein [Clostridia bacterium]|jgi:rubrerythrin